MKPHKHRELIKAWADGAIIEYRMPSHKKDTEWHQTDEPVWNDDTLEYRIQPEESKWYHNIPKSGVLCWIHPNCSLDDNYIVNINHYDSSSNKPFLPYFDAVGFSYAKPLSKEEIIEYFGLS